MLYPIILAGGAGTRLWPVSRRTLPKQFVELLPDQQSLFAATVDRLQGIPHCAPAIVVCNLGQRLLVAQQLERLEFPRPHSQSGQQAATILLEPVARNTAPAIAVAAFEALRRDRQAMLLVLPADHMLDDIAGFHSAVAAACRLAANDDRLVTFGIQPDGPETGYGYLQQGRELEAGTGFEVAAFVEKPDAATARACLAAGNYCWNSGMFLFRAELYLRELEKWAPAIHRACETASRKLQRDADCLRIPAKEFAACPAQSIDYAVMEKTSLAAMVPLHAGWSDLGAWDAVWEHTAKDGQGNALLGDVIQCGVTGSYVRAQSRLVAVLGITDQVVVETPDAVLVAAKTRAQNVAELVQQLPAPGRQGQDQEHHALVQRPWGCFESLARGAGYQVKRISVNPGAALSLQRHRHRCEHWIVVKGSALVHCDGREFMLQQHESTFIPLGSRHRLSNPGEAALEVIEVQIGDYLGEDDIERFEDLYGREDSVQGTPDKSEVPQPAKE